MKPNPKKFINSFVAQCKLKLSSTNKILKTRSIYGSFQDRMVANHTILSCNKLRRFHKRDTSDWFDEFNIGRLWFTDETHLHLNGFKKKYNLWLFWGTKIPHLCEINFLYFSLHAYSFSYKIQKKRYWWRKIMWLVNILSQFRNNFLPHSKR